MWFFLSFRFIEVLKRESQTVLCQECKYSQFIKKNRQNEKDNDYEMIDGL